MLWEDVATCGLFAQEVSQLVNGIEYYYPSPLLPLTYSYNDGERVQNINGIMRYVDENLCYLVVGKKYGTAKNELLPFKLDEHFYLDPEVSESKLMLRRDR